MKKKILVVDDDVSVTNLLSWLFSKKNYHAITAGDGTTAFKIINNDPPDLILSDVEMPGMDGYEFYNRLQKNPKTAGIPLIFLSGKKAPADQLKGLRMGAEEYMTKPFDFKVLYKAIENVFAKAEKPKQD